MMTKRDSIMKQGGYLFSNGTEFIVWQSRNCEKCVKSVFYDEKKDKYPKYRYAIQKHIEEAAITDGRGNKRDYEATHSVICPYLQTRRNQPRKVKKVKKDKNQLMLDF